jgi:hypothetical protein
LEYGLLIELYGSQNGKQKVKSSLSLLYELQEGDPLPDPSFQLHDPALNNLIEYSDYGEFVGVGTPKYQYIVKKPKELKNVIGSGIYPNENGVKILTLMTCRELSTNGHKHMMIRELNYFLPPKY